MDEEVKRLGIKSSSISLLIKGLYTRQVLKVKAAVIHELEKDGKMGRQLWINLPNKSTKGWSFVVANDELYLNGTTTGETGIAENQGGTDIFLAKISTGLEDAEVPFSGISIIPTAPRDSDGNLQTSEDGSSTSFRVRLNQEPLTYEDIVVTLTGLDSTKGSLSTNKLIFNRNKWDIPQDVVVTGVADNNTSHDAIYTIKATASNAGGYKGTESATINVKNKNGRDITNSTFYVSTNGNDSNSGSFIAPFRTIQHAINKAQAGDVVLIRGGTYRERLKIENLNGREEAPITFKNFENEEVILSGASPINSTWVKQENNIWKTNLNFDISQLYLDGKMLTAARWPNITKEWDQLDDSDRRNATPESYWDIEGTRALALVDPEEPNVYRNHENQQRLSDLDFSVDENIWAMLVPHKSFGLTQSGEIINHKAGESSFDVDPNFELWLRSPGQTALKNFNWTSGNDGSVETADLWPTKNGPVEGTKQFHYHLEGHLGFLDRPQEWHYDKESGDLYVWMPDDQDPNLSDLQARAWDRSSSYIADPDLHPDADYHVLLEIDNSSFLDFKGITLHTGIFEFNEATNLNFDGMRFLYPTYDGRMLKDGERPLYNNLINRSA